MKNVFTATLSMLLLVGALAPAHAEVVKKTVIVKKGGYRRPMAHHTIIHHETVIHHANGDRHVVVKKTVIHH